MVSSAKSYLQQEIHNHEVKLFMGQPNIMAHSYLFIVDIYFKIKLLPIHFNIYTINYSFYLFIIRSSERFMHLSEC